MYFTPCSSVSIVNFEHVTAGWVSHICQSEKNLVSSSRPLLFFLIKFIKGDWVRRKNRNEIFCGFSIILFKNSQLTKIFFSWLLYLMKLKSSQEQVSGACFLHNFSKKKFFLLYAINTPSFNTRPFLLFKISNMYFQIIAQLVYDVMNEFQHLCPNIFYSNC